MEVTRNHVFGVYHHNSSASCLKIAKSETNSKSLSKTCASKTYPLNWHNDFNFQTVVLEFKTSKPYRSPSLQPYIEDSGSPGELFVLITTPCTQSTKSTSKHLFWFFSLSQIGDPCPCQYLEEPVSTWKDHYRNISSFWTTIFLFWAFRVRFGPSQYGSPYL